MNALEIININYCIDSAIILQDINFAVKDKDFLGIIGPNGAGKTTLVKILAGLLSPDSGEILVYGKPRKESRNKIGYVPQFSEYNRHYPITVQEVVQMGNSHNKRKQHIKELAAEAMEKVNIGKLAGRMISGLSGGERQRMLIARALCSEPDILILDEPTASIDSQTGRSIFDLFQKLNEKMTLILISHDIGAISQSVKQIACLNKTLVFHDSREITREMLEDTYQCPVDLIAHGLPHRVLPEHKH